MLMKFLADAEGMAQFLHESSFLGSDGILLTCDGANTPIVVNMVEQTTVFHLPLRMPLDDGCLFLKLHDGNGLMHFRRQLTGFFIDVVARQQMGHELLARIITIHFEGKCGQWYEVDAVLLDSGQIGIAQTEAEHVADTGGIPCRGSHPEDVVIAPLNIPGMILPQGVHNLMGACTSVVDVAENV